MNTLPVCIADLCEKKPAHRNLCLYHYDRDLQKRSPTYRQTKLDITNRYRRKKMASMSWEERCLYDKRLKRQDLSHQFLEELRSQTPDCKCCSRPMDYSYNAAKQRSIHSATLDRIVPSSGYVTSNVAIICRYFNRLKNSQTLLEARQIVKYIETNHPDYRSIT